MPAPRSVLIDIHDRGLNPQVAHKSTDSSGRIKAPVVDKEPTLPTVDDVKKKPTKNALKALDVAKDEVSTMTTDSNDSELKATSDEGAGSVEHKQEEVPSTPVSARRKRTPSNS